MPFWARERFCSSNAVVPMYPCTISVSERMMAGQPAAAALKLGVTQCWSLKYSR